MVFQAKKLKLMTNAVAVATSNKNNQPNVRMVLLKDLSDRDLYLYQPIVEKVVN